MKVNFGKIHKITHFNDLKPFFHLRAIIFKKACWICAIMMEFGAICVENIFQGQTSVLNKWNQQRNASKYC